MLRGSLVAIVAIALCSMLWSEVSQANRSQGTKRVNSSFAGGGSEAGPDSNDDGILPIRYNVETRGAPGAGNSVLFVEGLEPGPPVGCPSEDFEIRIDLLASSFVTTFNDLSTLAGVGTSGFVCVDIDTGASVAESEGVFVGGSGRFEGASGTWTASSEGTDFGVPAQIRGQLVGEIVLP